MTRPGLIPLMADITADPKTGKVDWKALRREIEANLDSLANGIAAVSAIAPAAASMPASSMYRLLGMVTKTADTADEQPLLVGGQGSRNVPGSFWVAGRVVTLFVPVSYTLAGATTVTFRVRLGDQVLLSTLFIQPTDTARFTQRICVAAASVGNVTLNRFSEWASTFDVLPPNKMFLQGDFMTNKTLELQVSAQFSADDGVSTFTVGNAEMVWQPEPTGLKE